MKIALLANDGIVANAVLNNIIPQILSLGFEPIIYKNRHPDNKGSDIECLRDIVFNESTLLSHIVDSFMKKNKQLNVYMTDKNLANHHDIKYTKVYDVNDPDFIKSIHEDQTIVGAISIRFCTIFKSEIIKTFRKKGFFWNLHTGTLPKYKGRYIPYWALDQGEEFYGWTLHEIDEGIDTGAILAIDQKPLDPNKPILDTYLGMVEKACPMIMGALMFYKNYKRSPVPVPQRVEQESYFSFPTQADMDRWAQQGIVFSHDIVQTYLDYYTLPDTEVRFELKKRLEAAIELRDMTKLSDMKRMRAA